MRKTILFILLSASLLAFAEEKKDNSYWIARYLSVSYPLKKMTNSSGYGYRKDPFTGKKTFHGGLDFKANYEDVYSLFDGVVTGIGSDKRSGNYIIIRYGAYYVSYCHLSKRYVSKGDSVIAGEPVAVSGNTGRSTGPHLHLTVRLGKKVTDPRQLLSVIDHIRNECLSALGGKIQSELPLGKDFFSYYSALAMDHQRRYGIPASVTLSQMAHESDFGTSFLARQSNNFFGIKCSRSWLAEGKPYSISDDDRRGEKFCVYSSAAESMEHHSKVLTSSRYKKFCDFASTDYHRWLRGIKKAGYATSPTYVECCERLIRQYKLYYYDALAEKA